MCDECGRVCPDTVFELMFEMYTQALSIPPEKHREIILKLVKQNGLILDALDLVYQKDKEIVLEAVKENPHALQYADHDLKCNIDIALEAVKRGPYAFRHCYGDAAKNPEIALIAVTYSYLYLSRIDVELLNDKNFMLQVVQGQDKSKYEACLPYILATMSARAKQDRDVVLAAVSRYGLALQYVYPPIRHDKQVNLAAIQNSYHALRFIDKSLLYDEDIIHAAYSQVDNKSVLEQYLGTEFIDTHGVLFLKFDFEKSTRIAKLAPTCGPVWHNVSIMCLQ
jgi:hypothetical protein